MKIFKTYYRRNLPHYQPIGYTYFVTLRLHGSLPVQIIKQLKDEREKQLKEIAQIVKDAIHFYDNKKYDLICYTIMSNHVHQVFTPIVGRISDSTIQNNEGSNPRNRVSGYIVTKILQDLKRFTARECNKVLNRSGAFWQHESYDHVVRDYDELHRIVEYVINNPVKASLCDKWEDWKWSYCNISYL